ncbi:MAG: hypothetical protein NT124_04710 [Candidatus Dependentiae bacterium]|nr:hypothetical protein [Candidatus Dependentiae bacterium]
MNYLKKVDWPRIWTKVIYFIHLQAFLTLISMPILIAWGLPISLLSPIGNIIFGPPLTLFLLLSSLIFFCEIISIPNNALIWLLDKLTDMWTWSMTGDYKHLLIGFSCPTTITLIMIPVTACVIMQYRLTHPKKYAALLLSILLCVSCISLKIRDCYQPSCIKIPRSKGEIMLLNVDKKLTLIDPGYIGSTISAATWVTYTLIPEITKHTGTLTIDHLIVLQLNSATLEALTTLCTKINVKKLYLPWWTGILKGKGWHNYKKLSKALDENGGERIILKDIPITIDYAKSQHLLIKPTGKKIIYKNITYPAYCVNGAIDNHSFTIYAAKYTKMKRISQ